MIILDLELLNNLFIVRFFPYRLPLLLLIEPLLGSSSLQNCAQQKRLGRAAVPKARIGRGRLGWKRAKLLQYLVLCHEKSTVYHALCYKSTVINKVFKWKCSCWVFHVTKDMKTCQTCEKRQFWYRKNQSKRTKLIKSRSFFDFGRSFS